LNSARYYLLLLTKFGKCTPLKQIIQMEVEETTVVSSTELSLTEESSTNLPEFNASTTILDSGASVRNFVT